MPTFKTKDNEKEFDLKGHLSNEKYDVFEGATFEWTWKTSDYLSDEDMKPIVGYNIVGVIKKIKIKNLT